MNKEIFTQSIFLSVKLDIFLPFSFNICFDWEERKIIFCYAILTEGPVKCHSYGDLLVGLKWLYAVCWLWVFVKFSGCYTAASIQFDRGHFVRTDLTTAKLWFLLFHESWSQVSPLKVHMHVKNLYPILNTVLFLGFSHLLRGHILVFFNRHTDTATQWILWKGSREDWSLRASRDDHSNSSGILSTLLVFRPLLQVQLAAVLWNFSIWLIWSFE